MRRTKKTKVDFTVYELNQRSAFGPIIERRATEIVECSNGVIRINMEKRSKGDSAYREFGKGVFFTKAMAEKARLGAIARVEYKPPMTIRMHDVVQAAQEALAKAGAPKIYWMKRGEQ